MSGNILLIEKVDRFLYSLFSYAALNLKSVLLSHKKRNSTNRFKIYS